jgi:branched-chain amino acid transport system permease protein
MPDIKPFLVTGLAIGGIYALSGVGIVVLYRTTGVLNFAYGAIGAMGSFIAWQLINEEGVNTWIALLVAILFGGLASLLYGVVCGPRLADRDELVKATGTLGYALILLGIMFWIWSDDPRTLTFPTTQHGFFVGEIRVSMTQVLAFALAVVVTAATSVYLRRARLGTAMRALANDREITGMLGVPVRRVEAAAWFGSGLICGATGVLLASLLTLTAVGLTFLVISALAAALVGQLRSLWATLAGGIVIGLTESILTPFVRLSPYRSIMPFVIAIAVLLWLGRKHTVSVAQRGA